MDIPQNSLQTNHHDLLQGTENSVKGSTEDHYQLEQILQKVEKVEFKLEEVLKKLEEIEHQILYKH